MMLHERTSTFCFFWLFSINFCFLSLPLEGTRMCDVDESGSPLAVFQPSYEAASCHEPITAKSHFRSEAVIALSLLLRSDEGAGRTLKALALNDNALCPTWGDG